jgi:hypothetical protein
LKLHYFKASEFGDWWGLMDYGLLVRLDVLRHQWGNPIRISQAEGAIGRHDDSESQHNVDRWGTVRAVDIYPGGILDGSDAERFVLAATDVGFTGIGLYPSWSGGVGFHVDVRTDREPGYPATWGGVPNPMGQQKYVSLNDALGVMA